MEGRIGHMRGRDAGPYVNMANGKRAKHTQTQTDRVYLYYAKAKPSRTQTQRLKSVIAVTMHMKVRLLKKAQIRSTEPNPSRRSFEFYLSLSHGHPDFWWIHIWYGWFVAAVMRYPNEFGFHASHDSRHMPLFPFKKLHASRDRHETWVCRCAHECQTVYPGRYENSEILTARIFKYDRAAEGGVAIGVFLWPTLKMWRNVLRWRPHAAKIRHATYSYYYSGFPLEARLRTRGQWR